MIGEAPRVHGLGHARQAGAAQAGSKNWEALLFGSLLILSVTAKPTGTAGRKLADDWGYARNFTRRNLTGSLILHVAPRRDLQ